MTMIVMVVMSDHSTLKRDYHFDSSFYLKRILFVVVIGPSPPPPISQANMYSHLLLILEHPFVSSGNRLVSFLYTKPMPHLQARLQTIMILISHTNPAKAHCLVLASQPFVLNYRSAIVVWHNLLGIIKYKITVAILMRCA